MSRSLSLVPSSLACSRLPVHLDVQIWSWRPAVTPPGVFHETSPSIPHDALTGVGAGDGGELALEGGGERKTVQPFHLGRSRGERGVTRLRRAVHDEGCAGQRLE